jgi:hypothetical protein
VVATLIGGLAAIFYFVPRITIDAVAPFDPSQPAPIIFRLMNTNIVSLHDVDISLGVCSMSIILDNQEYPKPADCEGPSNVEIRFGRSAHYNWLLMDEPVDFPFQPGISWQLHEHFSANIEVRATYTPWLMPDWLFRRTKAFRLVTHKASDGKIYFRSTPLYQ